MSFPTGLFIDTPEIEDVSMHQLSEDTEVWPEEIVQKFRERVPSSAGMSTVVKFMKKDDENGTATGSILVSNEKKSAVIPIIVKDFMLFPLDVMQVDGKLVPLTEDYFKGAFSTNELFGKLEEYPSFGGLGRFEDGSLWRAIYPPTMGKYSSAPYPILEEISGTVDGRAFREYCEQNPTHILGFKKHGHTEIIKKLANLQPVNMNEFRQGASNLLDRNIVMLRKEGPNKYTVLANSDSTFSPVISRDLPRADFYSYVSKICDDAKDMVNEVDQNGEKLLYVPTHDEPVLAQPESEKIEQCDQFDHYRIRTKNGLNIEGYVIPKVIGFDQKIQDLKLFIGNTMSTIQPEIAGVRVKNSRFEMPACSPKPGQTGTFVFMPSKSKALATTPVTIESVTEDCGQLTLKVLDLVGTGFKLFLNSPGCKMFEAIVFNKHQGAYILPEGFKWVPMEGFERVSNSPTDYAAMGMGETKVAHPVHLIHTGYGQFSLKGANKYAQAVGWDHTNLEGWQAKFILASLGVSAEKTAQVVKRATTMGVAEVQHARFPALASEKIAAAVPQARKMVELAGKLRTNLTKEAGFMENSQTVDAMLSLNFVNPDNVSKFVSKIPSFKACISHLASVLVASRLGVREIPEQSVSTAMYRLLDVIEGLEALRATQAESSA